jgi:hypothetical protein
MRFTSILICLIGLCFYLLTIPGCTKETFTTSGNLDFSLDTLVFDTVFTTIGSTTQQFKIYNNNNKSILIDEVELMGGQDSPFRLNLDGVSGINHQDISLLENDSLYMFVEVTLGVNNQNAPLVIEDSIRFRTNGLDQYVNLAVWGQDAYFHYQDQAQGVWTSDKPHVIYGYSLVDSAETLTIDAGTQVHLHKNAVLYVYKSSLFVNGFLDNEVVFQGDRLEALYDDVPGQYYGIYFNQAEPSVIDYAVIKNGTSGIHVFNEGNNPGSYAVTVKNTKIFNHSSYGIFLFDDASIKGENLLIYKNGFHALLVLKGAKFNFNHCDFLGYGAAQSPAIGIRNYYDDPSIVSNIDEGKIYNSVLSGNIESELVLDTILTPSTFLNLDIQNCFIQANEVYTEPFFLNCLWRVGLDEFYKPKFNDVGLGDFGFSNDSPLQGSGFGSSILTDILGNFRNNPPDIGAIEEN